MERPERGEMDSLEYVRHCAKVLPVASTIHTRTRCRKCKEQTLHVALTDPVIFEPWVCETCGTEKIIA